jgi:diadenosine tetraphosphate (Ap4A) HIT family hydrolase
VPTSEADCPFCAIVRNRPNGTRELYRTEQVVAFFPTEPATLGHTLVIPTRHVETVTGLHAREISALARATVQLSRWIEDELHPEGLNLIQSNGEVAEQTVPHVHVHVVPRWENDGVGPIWPPETTFTEQEKDRTLRALVSRAATDKAKR